MSEIRTRPSTKEYRDNWDAIFGEKKSQDEVKDEDEKLRIFEDTVWNPTSDTEKLR